MKVADWIPWWGSNLACAGLAALACGRTANRWDPPNQNARPEQGLVSGKSRLRNRISEDCAGLRHDIRAHHGSARAADAEAVHQIQVAITRLRAAVAFFAPIVVDAEWLRLKKEIAWLNISLGAARDSDVSMEYARRKRYQAWAEVRSAMIWIGVGCRTITGCFAACVPAGSNA